MGTECGVHGVWGVLVDPSDVAGCVNVRSAPAMKLIQSIEAMIRNLVSAHEDSGESMDSLMDARPALRSSLIKLLSLDGVKVPSGATLFHTGTDDDRPGRCSTPPGMFVLGFGLFEVSPAKSRTVDSSFTKYAMWHTWVWCG